MGLVRTGSLRFYPTFFSVPRFLSGLCQLIAIMSKHEGTLETYVASSDASLDDFNGTSEDARDMDRLGRAQELKVYTTFTQWSWRNCSFLAEKLPISLDPWLDLCHHVHLDGNLVVSLMKRREHNIRTSTEHTTARARSPSSTAAEP